MTIFKSNKIIRTLQDLYDLDYIKEHNFKVTEELLNRYIRIYSSLSRSNKFEFNFARKMAGIVLLKLKLEDRKIKASEIQEGLVYAISNPAWPDHMKIGMSVNVEKRLSSFQTGDPFRAYKLEGYEFVLDKKIVEKELLNKFKVSLDETGEWISNIKYDNLINHVRSTYINPDINGIKSTSLELRYK